MADSTPPRARWVQLIGAGGARVAATRLADSPSGDAGRGLWDRRTRRPDEGCRHCHPRRPRPRGPSDRAQPPVSPAGPGPRDRGLPPRPRSTSRRARGDLCCQPSGTAPGWDRHPAAPGLRRRADRRRRVLRLGGHARADRCRAGPSGGALTLRGVFRSWGQPLSAHRLASICGRTREHCGRLRGRAEVGGNVPAPSPSFGTPRSCSRSEPHVPPHSHYTFPPGA